MTVVRTHPTSPALAIPGAGLPSCSHAAETSSSRGQNRRFGGRRADCSRRRLARAGPTGCARSAGRAFSRARRAARRAAARGRAHDERCRGGGGACGATRPGRSARAAPATSGNGTASSGHGSSRGDSRRRRTDRVPGPHVRRAVPRRAGADRARAGGRRRGNPHEDRFWLAHRPRRHRAPPARSRALLPGMASERRRRLGDDRDLQRRTGRHAVGGRVPGRLPDADRHAGAGRRRSGVVGRARAGCNGRTGG